MDSQASKARGAMIRAQRNQLNLTLEELAKLAKVSYHSAQRLESGANVTADILDAVTNALDKALRGLPQHPRFVEDTVVESVVREAVRAACDQLDKLFPGCNPEKSGISSNFAGQLEAHMVAMLTGRSASRQTFALKRLLYTENDFPVAERNTPAEWQAGFVVALEGLDLYLVDPRASTPYKRRPSDAFVSQEAARAACRQAIETHGHPPAPFKILPMTWDQLDELNAKSRSAELE